MHREVVNAGILGIGTYVPERILTNTELEKMVDTSDEWIRSRSGICERRIAGPEQATSDLASNAARRALADAGTAPEEIDLVICATDTADMIFPATACLVQDRIGVKKKAGAFDLAAGCTGFIYALTVGSQFIAAGACRRVLVIGAETMSRVIDWKDRSTCVLFGDGAGAVVLGPVSTGEGILATKLYSDGSGGPHLLLPAGGSRRPASSDTLNSRLHYLQMNGREVFKFAVRVMGEAAEEVIAEAGLNKSDVDFFIPHQANIRIIEPAARRLGVPMEKVMVNVDRYGNTSTASIPLALEEAVRGGRINKGDHVVVVGFGAGLTWGAVVIKW
ncbi:ketoacyl-ACP synthase III [Pelotomaculum isophthalicicum JI]|uniref:Beta-ketoacyl-[acyl-carrier-protein] synthase III n=1 Tax=Pelotomaculum isophthalicicum JI TaxID=947010 RepID=A0A9X4H7X0_9FIRM|nr:beta-ketoacyl-ACP synthase III [Pelotomaculum isophthalicicum]MDF9408104.1 ketoacyl-ACP synthase III [Pelotomaculum isophthalicicum JI]